MTSDVWEETVGRKILKRNGKLSLALHTLGHMAHAPDRVRTSSDIADHAGTNSVVVRRVLGQLRKAGLLSSEKGHAGGWKLARNPQHISLADVYLALDESIVATATKINHHECAIEHALHHRVSKVLEDVEQTLIERLSQTTIFEIRDTHR